MKPHLVFRRGFLVLWLAGMVLLGVAGCHGTAERPAANRAPVGRRAAAGR